MYMLVNIGAENKNLEFNALKPVFLFNLKYLNKNQATNSLKEFLSNRKSNNIYAVEIEIQNIDNSLIGFINNLKNHFLFVIGQGGTNKINRYFLENTNIDFLKDPQKTNLNTRIDFIHHFNSGLNHVLANLAKEKKISFIFSLDLVYLSHKNISKEFGRIKQNITILNKYDVKILLLPNYMVLKSNFINLENNHLYKYLNVKRKLDLDLEVQNKIKLSTNKYISEGICLK